MNDTHNNNNNNNNNNSSSSSMRADTGVCVWGGGWGDAPTTAPTLTIHGVGPVTRRRLPERRCEAAVVIQRLAIHTGL
jgi:hypothetical protein